MTDAPLILTLGFDPESSGFLTAMRLRHFPPARNRLPAHLTLFHHLPGEEVPAIAATLREATRATPSMTLRFTGLRFLGYGCAYEVECPALVALREELAAGWRSRLTPQDANGFRPHVTIQNKASSVEAKQTFAALRSEFQPFEASGTGLLLWHYRGGPWEAAGEFPFSGSLDTFTGK